VSLMSAGDWIYIANLQSGDAWDVKFCWSAPCSMHLFLSARGGSGVLFGLLLNDAS